MAGEKRERQKMNRQARIEAEQEARRKAARRRQTIWLVTIMVVVVGVLSFCQLTGGDDGDDVESGSTTTTAASTDTTTAAAGSVAGKPCVAVSESLPEGAPDVPVKVGPPPTALISEDLVVGDGTEVMPGDTVTAHYIGVSCSTGAIFDSSYSRGEPIAFSLSGVIQGWTDGIPGMKVGGRRLLGIPSDQAYATQGSPPKIAPDEALWFVVEIVATSPAE